MKAGINLGPSRYRTRTWMRRLVLVAFAATLAHVAVDRLDRRALGALRDEAALEGVDDVAAGATWTEAQSRSLWHLAAVTASGASSALSPTELLGLVERAVPEGVTLVSVTLEPSLAEPSVLVEALASRAEDIAELEARFSSASGVAETRLLEERLMPGGELSVRLRARLSVGETP